MENVSKRVQKKPDELYSYMINKRTLLVVRSGTLINISTELIRLGDQENLRKALHNLEKRDLKKNPRFPKILKTTIHDVFVDWDFQLDRSVIVFILRPVI